jgi:hypothetical protein
MLAFLLSNKEKAETWAQVQHISLSNIPAYVATLRPVMLRTPIAVTTHGFDNGRPTDIPVILTPGTAILVDQAGTPRTLCPCGNPLTSDFVMRDYLNQCKKAFELRQQPDLPNAQVDYPKELSDQLNESVNYVAAVDIHQSPQPPEQIIPGPTPAVGSVTVGCVLTARLQPPVDKSLSVIGENGTDGPVLKKFGGIGILWWNWQVTGLRPGDHQVTLILQPAVATADNRYVAAGSNDYDNPTAPFITTVHVSASTPQLIGQWWSDNWPVISSIATAIGGALIGLVAFSVKFRDAVAKAFQRSARKEDSA